MLVLLSSTSNCNARCRYCSGRCGEHPDAQLLLEDCQILAAQLPDILKPEEPVVLLWHGGEPTLLAPDTFMAMQGTLVQALQTRGHPVRCTMQSNALAVNSEWIGILRECDMHIGVSLDGPREINDAYRVDTSGAGLYDRVMRSLEALRAAGVSTSILCTLTPEHLAHTDAFLHWLNDLGLNARINPLLALGRSASSLSHQEYYAMLQTIFVFLCQTGIGIRVQPLEGMLCALLHDIPLSECSFSGRCARNIMGFGPNAQVFACNRLATPFGSLHDTPLASLWHGEQATWLRERQARLHAQCGDCPIHAFCHGGCAAAHGDTPDLEYCRWRRHFFAWLQEDGLNTLRTVLVERKRVLRRELDALHMSEIGGERHV